MIVDNRLALPSEDFRYQVHMEGLIVSYGVLQDIINQPQNNKYPTLASSNSF